MRQTTDYEVLAASTPINRQAAIDMAARGNVQSPEDLTEKLAQARQGITHSDRCNPEFKDMTGFKKGRLTVIGKARGTPDGAARWLVRCICGRYETRRTRALRPDNPNDRCFECDRLARLREGAFVAPKR